MAFERRRVEGRWYRRLFAKLLILLAKGAGYQVSERAAMTLAWQMPYEKRSREIGSDNNKLGKVPGGGYKAGSSGRKLPLFLFWRSS